MPCGLPKGPRRLAGQLRDRQPDEDQPESRQELRRKFLAGTTSPRITAQTGTW